MVKTGTLRSSSPLRKLTEASADNVVPGGPATVKNFDIQPVNCATAEPSVTDIAGSDATNSMNRASHLLKEGQSSKLILAMLIESDEEEPRGTAPA